MLIIWHVLVLTQPSKEALAGFTALRELRTRLDRVIHVTYGPENYLEGWRMAIL